jgi:Tfp pilus assembly protein PilF
MPKAQRLSEKRFPWRRWLVWGAVLGVVATGAALLWPWARATAYLTDARRALSVGDPETALRSLGMACRLQPDRAGVQYLLAVAKRRSGRLDEFAPHLQRAAELGWPKEDVQRQAWLAAAQRGDLVDVQHELLAAVQSEATNEVAEEIYEAFAKGSLCTYRLHDAQMCVDIWLQWRPDAPQGRIMRACVHEQYGDYEQAWQEYRAVLSQRPDHREARVRLGQALMIKKRYDEAHAEFQARLAVAPDDVDALLGAAQCARHLGHADEARNRLQTALPLTVTPHQRGSTLRELGRLLLDEGKTSESLQLLTQAVAILPGDAQAHYALGTALARVGRRDEAQYHHARMQHLREQFDRMTEITRRLTAEPANADLRCDAGAILMDAGLKKEGADWLLTALKCDPSHRRSHELLAEYYAESGNQSLAARHRLLAAQAPPPNPKSQIPSARQIPNSKS